MLFLSGAIFPCLSQFYRLYIVELCMVSFDVYVEVLRKVWGGEMAVVLTACTNRKRFVPCSGLRAETLAIGSLSSVAASWRGRLLEADERVIASKLYAGRGFLEATAAASVLQAELYIVSAGLGLVRAETVVPPYALSVAGQGGDNVLLRIVDGADAEKWWRDGASQSPFSLQISEVMQATHGPVIVALSRAYLAMIASDLVALSPSQRGRLRIVTRAALGEISPALRPFVLPYNDRLDGVDGCAGTLSDFSGRAAHHFARLLGREGGDGDIMLHASSVQEALEPYQIRVLPERRSLDDKAILALIREHWDAGHGQGGRLLRILRDDLFVRCEQSRFAGLVRRVRDEKKAGQ